MIDQELPAGALATVPMAIPNLPRPFAFMCKALERISETTSVEREEFACTVMVGKAADVPEFAPPLAA